MFRNVSDLRLEDIAPDGTLLVAQQIWRQDIFLVQRGKPGERRLSWYDWASLAEISPDGTWLAFTQAAPVQAASGLTPALTLTRKTDGSPAQILGDGYALAISPDGRWVAASSSNYLQSVVVHPTGAGSRTSSPPGSGDPASAVASRREADGGGGSPPLTRASGCTCSSPGARRVGFRAGDLSLADRHLPDDRWVAVVGPTRTDAVPDGWRPHPSDRARRSAAHGWSAEATSGRRTGQDPTRLVRFDVERRRSSRISWWRRRHLGSGDHPRIRLTPDGRRWPTTTAGCWTTCTSSAASAPSVTEPVKRSPCSAIRRGGPRAKRSPDPPPAVRSLRACARRAAWCRSTAERRKTQSEDRAHVAVARAAEDALLETPHGLVEEEKHRPLRDFVGVERNARLPAGHGVVDGRVDFLPRHVVPVEALLGLATEAPFLMATASASGAAIRRRTPPPARSSPWLRRRCPPRRGAEQPHRKPVVAQRRVDGGGIRALDQEVPPFQVQGQDA